MANKNLFESHRGNLVPRTGARNGAGGKAYAFNARHALAQLAATGCLNDTFYANGRSQLDDVLKLSTELPARYIAQAAIYARERAFMKDMPALLLAQLTVRDGALAEKIFDRVIDDARMLRNFVQILRSGTVGRKSLGSRPKRMVRRWLAARSEDQLFRASVGNAPSLADVVKLTHPRPSSVHRSAFYAWLLGKTHQANDLPAIVRAFEAFKADRSRPVPDVPFQMLTSLPLDGEAWKRIAERSSWQQLRMNLNTFARQCVFADDALTTLVADRLRDASELKRARVLPYQLMVAYSAADPAEVPNRVRWALHDAMEIALESVPRLSGTTYVCPDVSGSMSSPVTGRRPGATSVVRCIDVAALVSAALLRKSKAEVIPFDTAVRRVELNPHDSVMTNAKLLAGLHGGGTACSAPLAALNARRAMGDLVIIVSDNESWADSNSRQGTALQNEWEHFRQRNRGAKLICIDVQPNKTSQISEGTNRFNVGGFSDAVFELIAAVANGQAARGHWVAQIEAIEV